MTSADVAVFAGATTGRDITLAGVRLQDEAIATLGASLRAGRISQTYLFLGPPSVGRRRTALAFAAALQCQSPVPTGKAPTTGEAGDINTSYVYSSSGPDLPIDACGQCESCRRLQAGTHPDVTVLTPRGTEIRVDQIRTLQDQASLKPYFGAWRVFVIDPADALNEAASNCVLKILEEAPPRVLFILIAAARHKLLPTIISRAVALSFAHPRPREARAALTHLAQVAPDQAARALAQTEGRFGLALRLLARGQQAVAPDLLAGHESPDHAESSGDAATLGQAQEAYVRELARSAEVFTQQVPPNAGIDLYLSRLADSELALQHPALLAARKAMGRQLLRAAKLPAAWPVLTAGLIVGAIDDARGRLKKAGERLLADAKSGIAPAMAKEMGEQLTAACAQFAWTQHDALIGSLCNWVADAWHWHCVGDESLLLNLDRHDDIMAMARIWGYARLERALRLTTWCQQLLLRNVNPQLILENLLANLVAA